jgi:hypothetical protein
MSPAVSAQAAIRVAGINSVTSMDASFSPAIMADRRDAVVDLNQWL